MRTLLRASLILPLLALGGCSRQAPEQSSAAREQPRKEAHRSETASEKPEAPSGSTRDRQGMMGDGMMGDGMMGDGMMGDGMMGDGMMRDMRTIRLLLAHHEEIEREVEDIPGGVRTATTSSDAQVAQAIRQHVWQMKSRLESGQPIRMMDPLFREIFAHHDQIGLQIEEIPGGARVTETSGDPRITALIRQHARRAVSEFVEDGMRRAMQPTALPEGYTPQGE